MNKKEREIHESRRNGLKKSSLLVSNIGNDDIISWTPVRGLKTGMGCKGRPEKGREKWHFLVWNRVRIWRIARHTLTKNSQEYSNTKKPFVDRVLPLFSQVPLIKKKFSEYIQTFLNWVYQCVSHRTASLSAPLKNLFTGYTGLLKLTLPLGSITSRAVREQDQIRESGRNGAYPYVFQWRWKTRVHV